MVALRALAALDDSFTLPRRRSLQLAMLLPQIREQIPPHCLSTLTRKLEFDRQTIKITKEIHNCFMKIFLKKILYLMQLFSADAIIALKKFQIIL